MGGLSAWQGLFDYGRLQRGERVIVTGASGEVGHLAVQLAQLAGAEVVAAGPADLVFDTAGGELPAADRVVTVAHEAPGAVFFVVEPNRGQLIEIGEAGLQPEIDSIFPLDRAREAFDRVASRGKHGKVVFDVAGA